MYAVCHGAVCCSAIDSGGEREHIVNGILISERKTRLFRVYFNVYALFEYTHTHFTLDFVCVCVEGFL